MSLNKVEVAQSVSDQKWGAAESLLSSATEEELMDLWKDAGYVKERARYILKAKFGKVIGS